LDKSIVDRNPFIEFVDEVEDFGYAFKSIAMDVISRIDKLHCDDKEIFKDILDGARKVIEKIERVDDFEFDTDEPHPTRGGDKLWLDIVNSVGEMIAKGEALVKDWDKDQYPDEFVGYFERLPELTTAEIQKRRISFEKSQVWIFLNFFHPFRPFFCRVESGHYIVQKYKKCMQTIDMQSIALYFMVRFHYY
jgi:hypothetical protein